MPHAAMPSRPQHRREEPDVQWLERMYDTRLRVPDHAERQAQWAAESARVRATLACELDVAYGSEPGETLDVFPAPRRGAPVVVFIHGGHWRSLDKSQHGFLVPALRELGAMVVLPNYTLAPRATIPAITLQVARALAWSWRHARRYGGDAHRIVVIGHGAGAQLAAMMLACAWKMFDADLPPRLVGAVLGLSGVYDLEPLMQTPSLQEALRLTPAQVLQASPARLPAPDHGRLLAVVGADESGEHLRQNQLIRQAWGRERVPLATALPGLNHFSILDALARPGSRVHRLAARLIA